MPWAAQRIWEMSEIDNGSSAKVLTDLLNVSAFSMDISPSYRGLGNWMIFDSELWSVFP
jgi:hypothetical protein